MSQGHVTPFVTTVPPARDAFADLRRELFHHHPLIGNFDSSSAYSDKDESHALRYRAQLHNEVRPSPYNATSGKSDLLTWYTRIEFAPTPLLLSLYAYPSPSDVVAQGEQIAFLRSISRKRLPLEPERLLGFLGTSDYANSYFAFALPHTIAAHGRISVLAAFRKRLAITQDPILVATLLDLAAQHILPIVNDEEMLPFAERWATERKVRHAFWRYLATRPLDLPVQAYLLDTIASNAPVYDRLLAIEVLRGHGIPPGTLEKSLVANPHPLLTAHLYPSPMPTTGFTVAQSMLMGRFTRPGEGNSGGLSVFLAALGSTLTETEEVARVVTVVLADESVLESQSSLIEEITPGHWVLSLPFPIPQEADQRAMMHDESAMAWWARHLLTRYHFQPKLLHVRYADNGSLAMVRAAKQLGAKVTFTVTPDPHRTMAARFMETPIRDIREHETLLFDLHKIFIADMILREADGLAGIPGRANSEHLTRYFPQLTAQGNPKNKPLQIIAEGVTLWEAPADFEEAGREIVTRLYESHPTQPRLDPAQNHRPILLNVGRFSPVKQQDKLVAAWLHSGLWQQFNLVLIGGNLMAPTAAEADMVATIQELLDRHPKAAGRIAVLPAMSNRDVRLLEAALVQFAPASLPHIYVCSSAKEEFGIAVLEAMDAGLLAVGPLRGGLSSYLQDGVNGYLVNTATTESLSQSLRTLLQSAFQHKSRLRTIAEAGTHTVRTRFDLRRIATAFATYYAELSGLTIPTSHNA
jgi:D-inositol-3-phosphate glycosyltransferase